MHEDEDDTWITVLFDETDEENRVNVTAVQKEIVKILSLNNCDTGFSLVI